MDREIAVYRTAIKVNRNDWYADECGICGELVNVEAGPGLYMLESWEPICIDCGRVMAPELVRILSIASAVID